MAKLRESIRRVQILENQASDKAGVAMLAFDESKANSGSYRKQWIDKMTKYITPEAVKAAAEGKKLVAEVLQK
jgi:hypothetical protein